MKYTRIRGVKNPTRGTPGSAGIDFYVPEEFGHTLKPGESINIPSGLKVKIPEGHVLVMMNKSGIATKKELIVGACVVDEDYQVEVHLHVINVGKHAQVIESGMKLVQGIILPVAYTVLEEVLFEEVLYPEASKRGASGFGSTGI
jgi:dUTP pyrophosphatase